MPEEQTAAQTQEHDAVQAAVKEENPTMEGSRTYTQEELDEAVKKAVSGAVRERIDRANAKSAKQAEEDASRIAELEESLTKATEGLDKVNGELDNYKKREQMAQWAHEVSEETGIPADILRGQTKNEMKEHAEAIKLHLAVPSVPYVASDGFAAENRKDSNSNMREFAHTFFSGSHK